MLTNPFQSLNFFPRIMRKILPAKCPEHLAHKTAKKGFILYITLTCDIETFMINVCPLSVSSKCIEAFNDIFNFVEMKGDSLVRLVLPRERSLLLAIQKILKC